MQHIILLPRLFAGDLHNLPNQNHYTCTEQRRTALETDTTIFILKDMKKSRNLPSAAYGVRYRSYRIKICVTVFFLFVTSLLASAKYAMIPRPFNRNLGKASVIDTSFMQIYYALNADNPKRINTYEDYQCLEIGRRCAKYHSTFLEEGEQKSKDWLAGHKGAASMPNVTTDGKRGMFWSEYQYADLYIQKETLTGYYCFPLYLTMYNAYCSENFPMQKWEIGKDTLTVCGYVCQQATSLFRGRKFTAWFSKKIPARYGPWKFGGLPGLILKVEDSDHLYTFECVKIERKKKPIQKYSYEKYQAKKRTEILKLQRRINENFFQVVGVHNSSVPVSTLFTPYSPMELE